MMKWESALRARLMKNALWLGMAAVFALGVLIRYSYLPLLAADLEFMNASWWEAIQRGGMAAVLDPELQYTYSPLHLYLWTLAVRLLGGMDTHLALKLVSLLLEALLCGACTWLIHGLLSERRRAFGTLVGFAMLWLNPILIWNAAGWGQTDASFALFSVLSVLLLLKDRPGAALVMLSVALAWKLQAIFLLPLFGMAYFCGTKRFSALWFLTLPGMLIASGLPMTLIGQSPLFALNVYLGQTSLYTKITYNCPNLYALMGDAAEGGRAVQGMFSRTGIALCVAALGLMLVWMIVRGARPGRAATVLLGAWCVLCCVFFLPRMHERYALVGELLLLCWAVAAGKPRAYVYVAANALATLSAYASYLFREPFFSLQLGGLVNLAVLAALSLETLCALAADAPPRKGEVLG